jgi:hypothetical protein
MPGRGCVIDLELRAFLLGDLPEPQSDGASSQMWMPDKSHPWLRATC